MNRTRRADDMKAESRRRRKRIKEVFCRRGSLHKYINPYSGLAPQAELPKSYRSVNPSRQNEYILRWGGSTEGQLVWRGK